MKTLPRSACFCPFIWQQRTYCIASSYSALPLFFRRYLTSISTSFSDTEYSHLFTVTEFVHQHLYVFYTRKCCFPYRFVFFSAFFVSFLLLLFPSALLFYIFCTVHLPSCCSLFSLPSPAISSTLSCYFLCPPLLFPILSCYSISSALPFYFLLYSHTISSTFSCYFLCPPLLFLTLFRAIASALPCYFLYHLVIFP